MAPPISSWSTTLPRFWITSILSETLAPPRMATHGRVGIGGGHAQVLQFLLHQQAGGGLRHELDHAHGGGVRAVRGAERVVHVDVAERGQLAWRTRDRSSLLRRGSAGFRAAALRRARASWLPLRARCNRAPSSPAGPAVPASRAATGFRLISGFGLPLGRPRCDARMTPAPCSSAY